MSGAMRPFASWDKLPHAKRQGGTIHVERYHVAEGEVVIPRRPCLAVFCRALTFILPLALFLPLNALAQIKWVEFSTYYPGIHFSPIKSGLVEPAAIAIRSMDEWSEVWKELHPVSHRPSSTVPGYEASNPTQPEQEPVPSIDFSKFTLLMVASGRYPGTGYAIALTSIVQDHGVTIVKVLKTSPGKECGVLDVPTSPIAFALIPRTDHAIVFDIAEVKEDCANHEMKRIDALRSNGSQN